MYTTGFPSPASEFAEKNLDLNALIIGNPSATFLMIAEGENNPEYRVNPGDILVVDRSIIPSPEDIIVSYEDDDLQLTSYNKSLKASKAASFPGDWPDSMWGVVTWIIHRSKAGM